jgi:hypothetical protein
VEQARPDVCDRWPRSAPINPLAAAAFTAWKPRQFSNRDQGRAAKQIEWRITLLRHVFYSPRMTVPDNIVKQIAEGRPVVLALLCSGLRAYYLPPADDLAPSTFQFSRMAAAAYPIGASPACMRETMRDGSLPPAVLAALSKPIEPISARWTNSRR